MGIVWDMFRAFCDAVLAVCSFVAFYHAGIAFYRRFLCRESEPRYATVRYLFATTFALSFSLNFLIVCEILAVMSSASRKLHWRFDIYALTLLLTFVLPLAQCYFVMIDRGSSHLEAVKASVLFEIGFMLTLWRLGDPSTMRRTSHSIWASLSSLFSVEAGISRVLVVGTSLLAILSGFTAVDLPFSYLYVLFRPVSRTEVEALEDRLMESLDTMRIMKDQEAVRAPLSSSNDAVDQMTQVPPVKAAPREAPLMQRLRVGIRRFYENVVYGENVPLEGDEPHSIAVDKAARVSFLDYHESLSAWRASQYSRTPIGVLASILGYCLLAGCVVRVILAVNSIATSGASQRSNPLDTIHKFLAIAGVDADVQIISQYFTFAFTSVLLSVNIRAALRRITLVFSLVSTNSTLSSSAAIFLAQVLGAYFLSSIVLIRSLLPLGYRATIAEALGDLEYRFYRRWFDYLFISSAAVGTIVLALQAKGHSIRSILS